MLLAIFDLDGTLADTLAADHRCFIDAFRLEHGISFTDDDWSTYRYTTDSGITPEVLERHLGRPPTGAEVERHKRRFLELLEAAAAERPEGFREVAGAAELLAGLGARPGWRAVIATGSWRESARLKLRLAGLDRFELPLASADDGLAREEIVAHGAGLAEGDGPFAGVVLVGDKPWDLAAARHFGYGFVGVGPERRKLTATSHAPVFEDWRSTSAVLAALEEQATGHPA